MASNLIKTEPIWSSGTTAKGEYLSSGDRKALFKKNKDFINDYVKTNEMSAKDKLKDLELMIEAFVEEERYEDCALLVKIKEKVIKYYEKSIIKKQL